jgi:methylmalonyl-CoA mutase
MSDSNTKSEPLFTEFDPTSTDEWEDVLTRDLKGADYKKKLSWNSIEGIDVLPFYRKEDLEKLPHLADGVEINTPADWQFCEPIDKADPAEANTVAKEALEKGADALWFTIQFDPDEGMLGGDISGVRVQKLDDLKTLLDGINLKTTKIVFDSGAGSIGVMGLVHAMTENSDESIDSFSFLFDPFTYMAGRGRLALPEEQLNSAIEQMADSFHSNTLAADGSFYHNCGATIVQELGIALSIASDFLARVPEEKREKAAKKIWMHLSAGSLYFPEIAKFRAARLLWTRLLDGYGVDTDIPLTIHASTSQWNKSIADPHNNMLRATTEATSAAVGGANRITIHPYNTTFETSDTFSRRIARNVSHILDEESHLTAVDNPGDGSYYIEVLTDEIAKKAWEFFQLIEKQGGFQRAVEAGVLQIELGKSRKEKEQALATRDLVLTGVNNYPDTEQDLPSSLFQSTPTDSLHQSEEEPEINQDDLISSLSNAFKNGATVGDVITSFLSPQKQLYTALKTYRAAQPFEEIRLRTQKLIESRGKNITVQLIPIGNKKMRKARATFSQNYLGCAGFHVENHLGFDSVQDAANEIDQGEGNIFVLCSSDDEYPDLVPDFCEAFGDNSVLILAGYPKEHIESFEESGIDQFIYSGSNMLETLSKIQDMVEG